MSAVGHRVRWPGVALLSVVVLAGASVPLACVPKKQADAPMPAPQDSAAPPGSSSAAASAAPPDPSAPASVAAPAASASAAPTALATVLTTDPNQLAQMFAAAASAATAALQPAGTAPAGESVDAKLTAIAKKHAPGMQAEGPTAKGMLQEGGHLETMVTLQGGKCYSIVGYSPPGGVKDLDLHLLAAPFYTFLAGQDTTDDNTPVVGKDQSPMCPVIPIPIAYKIDIFARKGGGPVEVQLYSKTK